MSIEEITAAIYRNDYVMLDSKLSVENINDVDEDGRTALMHAVLSGNANAEMIDYLVDRGISVNAFDDGQHWTALHFAARDQKPKVVELLLAHKAEVDSVDSFGNTPLWRSVMFKNPDIAVVQVLLTLGADPNKKNNHGVSPLDIAKNTGSDALIALLQS